MNNSKRSITINIRLTPDEHELIQSRMTEIGTTNTSAFMRKMAINGQILHVDLSPVKEIVSLQRRCANNLNQVAMYANSAGLYPEEIAGLRRDYEALWSPLKELLAQLAEIVEMG